MLFKFWEEVIFLMLSIHVNSILLEIVNYVFPFTKFIVY